MEFWDPERDEIVRDDEERGRERVDGERGVKVLPANGLPLDQEGKVFQDG